MDAIQTKYLSATNSRGARIKANLDTVEGLISVTVSYNYALGPESNHREAANALLKKLHSLDTQAPNEQGFNRWRWKIATGELADGSYAHVWTGDLP